MNNRLWVTTAAIALGLTGVTMTHSIAQEEQPETPEIPESVEAPELEDFEDLAEDCRTRSGQAGLTACDRALEINGQDTSVWINRGIKLDRDLSDPNRALDSYYQAVQFDANQDYSLAWFNQCALLLKIATRPSLGDDDQLRFILQELELMPKAEPTPAESTSAEDLEPVVTPPAADLAPSPTLLYKAVINTCDRAINGDQDWGNASIARAWNNVGYAQDELGNFGLALEAYEAAIAEDPEHIGAWNNKAITLENLERPAAALEAYDRALELDPNYTLARRNRARVLRSHPELRAAPEENQPDENEEQELD